MVLFQLKTNNSNFKLAATRNVKAIRPLLDRVLVSRIKAEAVKLQLQLFSLPTD